MLKIHIKQNINLPINKRQSSNGSKIFIEYSNGMDDIYKNIKEYNPKK